jgi:hypothetical protein
MSTITRRVEGKRPGEAEAVMSFVQLKRMARNLLPGDSLLRGIILSERDFVLRAEDWPSSNCS